MVLTTSVAEPISILRATSLWKVVMKCKNVMFYNIWTLFWKCIFLRLWHFSSPTTYAIKLIVLVVVSRLMFLMKHFFFSLKNTPSFCQAAPLNLQTVQASPLLREFPLSGVFLSTLLYHHFCIPNWICKKPMAFSHVEDMKKSAGVCSVL